MAARFSFTPESASFPSTGFAVLKKEAVTGRMYVAFTDNGSNVAYWNAVAPENFAANASGNVSLHVTYFMASDPGGSGTVQLYANLEAPVYNTSSEKATANLFSASYANVTSNVANIGGTNFGMFKKIILDCPSDSLQPDSYFRVRIERTAQAGTQDTASGDFGVLSVELKDSL